MSFAFARPGSLREDGGKRRPVLATTLALVAAPLTLVLSSPSSANPAGDALVITEAYVNGGSAGATYTHKFVEIYNPTSAAVPLTGLSLQYRSPTGTAAATGVAALSGTVPAHDYFVVQGGSNGANGSAVPGVDQVASGINPGAGGGTLFVATGTTAVNPTTTPGAVVDKLGWGTSNSPETTASTVASVTTALQRQDTGGVVNKDTDDNSADFTALAPTPGAGFTTPPPPDEVDATIAEIQGTGAASPLAGDTVTTQGVVTATYPTGGLNGFYLQTGGSGGGVDATPGASDGLFVYGPTFDESTLSLGDSVEVTGPVSEFNGTTEITAGTVTDLPVALPAVTPLAAAYPTTEAAREAHEGELLAPTDALTVTNTFTTNRYAEIGLATGTTPLIQPTDVADAQDTAAIAAVVADNAARAVTLDDGASIDFLPFGGGANQDIALPWLAKTNPVRVGATVDLQQPVILEFRNNVWKLQPQARVTGTGTDVATFTNTRLENAAPQSVGGNLKLATFNVLNYFNTTGEDFVANGGSCTYFLDRDDNRVANNSCTPDGPRGAAQADDLARQQAKIVTAINGLGADIVSLEEVENSVKLLTETDRDDALSHLVAALNAQAGAGTWAFAPSPAASDLPALAEQDVIRTAFIFKPATVSLVGASKVLVGAAAFGNAREPLAQAFKPAGTADSQAFAVIVNHFKSKGSGVDDGTGQGNANPDRIAQAEALSTFADAFAAERGTDKVFLTGDFNSYTQEDPLQVLYADGYTALESDTAGESSYSFSGLSGSLDHVLANEAALAMVTGVDLWDINASESVAFQYSRHNYNLTDFFEADNPFAASDHNPEIVGLDTTPPEPATRDIQLLATNDFHGRLTNNSNNEAGAAVLAGAVKSLRAANPDTVFAAAGDLIGASTFESFIANDKPTIDALNEAGLEVSAVGNHEFDQGYDDLVNRVMASYDAETNPQGGATWEYIGANVRLKATGDPAVPATWIKEFGSVEVGFVGAVTEDLPSLVNPDGISELEVTDIVESTNAEADALVAEGVDVVVLLVHEGAPGTNCDTMDDNPSSAFGSIIAGVNTNVDAIVSGHTHLAYNCSFPVPAWVAEGRAVTSRPVVSAGQYGSFLNKLVFTVDTATGDVSAKTQDLLNLESCSAGTACGGTGQPAWLPNYPVDAATKAIVDAAVAAAVAPGNVVLGKIGGIFARAKFANGTTENRGGESTLGNQVAEVQRWATPDFVGGAQIAFMNPGGLRGDMVGNVGEFPRDLTYRQAANVQPFANTLVNMDLTGAQIETVLEQQWQRSATGSVPTRAFLRLGVSSGFEYTYTQFDDPAKPGAKLGEVTSMWLNGEPIDPAATYSVTVNSFLAAGGDNFRELANGAAKQDTGVTDLQSMVSYMAEYADTPLPVDYAQRAVGVTFPAGAPSAYLPGEQVGFDLFSLSMTDPSDRRDTSVAVSLDGEDLGTFPVTTTISSSPDGSANSNDDAGTASVAVTVPAGTAAGSHVLTVTGATTGTTVEIPVEVAEPAATTLTAAPVTTTYGTDSAVEVGIDPVTATGTVKLLQGEEVLGEGTLAGGATSIAVGGTDFEPGSYTLTLEYAGDAAHAPSTGTVQLTVERATPLVAVTASATTLKMKKDTSTLSVDVSAAGFTPTGFVAAYVDGVLVGSAELVDGGATVVVGPFDTAGAKQVTVVYLGDAHAVRTTSAPLTLTVVKGKVK